METDNDQNPVIVTSGATSHSTRVHHRDFPEIRADGDPPKTQPLTLPTSWPSRWTPP